jgi:hypothetical protein
MAFPRTRPLVLFIAVLGALHGAAQAFPDGATVPSVAALNQHLNDKVFRIALADGSSWRVEFKASGYVFVDTSQGRSFKGEWKAEEGRVCTKVGQAVEVACSEARLHDGQLYVKRAATGELVKYQPT